MFGFFSWSFGVLFWEMMTLGGTPYPGLPPEELLDFLNNDKRMPQPAQCPLEIYTIMRDCWNKDPELRPTFPALVDHLGRILEKRLEKVQSVCVKKMCDDCKGRVLSREIVESPTCYSQEKF